MTSIFDRNVLEAPPVAPMECPPTGASSITFSEKSMLQKLWTLTLFIGLATLGGCSSESVNEAELTGNVYALGVDGMT